MDFDNHRHHGDFDWKHNNDCECVRIGNVLEDIPIWINISRKKKANLNNFLRAKFLIKRK